MFQFNRYLADSYYLIGAKVVEFFHAALQFPGVEFVMKADDDSFVRVDRVMSQLDDHRDGRLFMGCVVRECARGGSIGHNHVIVFRYLVRRGGRGGKGRGRGGAGAGSASQHAVANCVLRARPPAPRRNALRTDLRLWLLLAHVRRPRAAFCVQTALLQSEPSRASTT